MDAQESERLVPYFPAAFAVSDERPTEFNFQLRVLDTLSLPCPIRGDRRDGPVHFQSVTQAADHLHRELEAWSAERRAAGQTTETNQPPSLCKEELFLEEGTPLAAQLVTGDPELDGHLHNVRLDR